MLPLFSIMTLWRWPLASMGCNLICSLLIRLLSMKSEIAKENNVATHTHTQLWSLEADWTFSTRWMLSFFSVKIRNNFSRTGYFLLLSSWGVYFIWFQNLPKNKLLIEIVKALCKPKENMQRFYFLVGFLSKSVIFWPFSPDPIND